MLMSNPPHEWPQVATATTDATVTAASGVTRWTRRLRWRIQVGHQCLEGNERRRMEMHMNIRRLVLDVDKAIARPSIVEIAQAIETVRGVAGFNITVLEIDVETIGMEVTVEGENLDYQVLEEAIEGSGAVVHSIDQLVAGTQLVESIPRRR